MVEQPGETARANLNNVAAAPVKAGTQTPPPAEMIAWSVSSNGTFLAQTSGQQLSIAATQLSDGSEQVQLIFSHSSQAPYLTITSLVEQAKNSVSLTFSASPSQLTLTISNINQAVTLGTATISGLFGGQSVNWTGSFDMSTNPLLGKPLPGWPANAFADELTAASVFGPLAWVLNASWPTTAAVTGLLGGAPLHMDGLGLRSIVKALVVGGIAVIGAAALTTSAPAIAVAGLVAVDSSLWSDIISEINLDVVKPTAAVYEPPVTETVQVPVRTVSQDDPPPPPGGPVLPSGFLSGASSGPPVVVVGPPIIDPDPPPPPPPPPINGDQGNGDEGGPPGGTTDSGGGEGIDDKPGLQDK